MKQVKADVLIVNARPWSEGAPLPGLDALALQGSRVIALGRGADLEALAGPHTRRLDAAGGTVTPGLSDAHLHLVAWARSRSEVALGGLDSRGAVATRVAEFLRANPGESTVIGWGWDAGGWAEPPHRAVLDAVSARRPLLLHSKDYHALWVNGAALDLAGVTSATADPDGGRIERDAGGEPTGVLREHAVRLFAALIPPRNVASDLARVRQAAATLLAEGVTTVHDFEAADEMRVLRAMTRSPGPRVRVLMHLPHAACEQALGLGLESGLGDDAFRIGALKLFADGTLGSRTAALLAPYDGSAERGMELIPPDELRGLVARALAGGLSLAIHAIGDRAVRSALDAFAAAGAEAVGRAALPPRIEHAQLVDPADLPRFAELGVAASMQPSHCPSDAGTARRYWASRERWSYPWRSLVENGALLAFGSDAPVEPPSAAHGLHAAVTRRPIGSRLKPFVPEQCVSLDVALRAYTEGPARLAGAWPRLGRIAPGATADLVVWNADLHRLPLEELAGARPKATLLEGEIVHEAGTAGGVPAAAATTAEGAP